MRLLDLCAKWMFKAQNFVIANSNFEMKEKTLITFSVFHSNQLRFIALIFNWIICMSSSSSSLNQQQQLTVKDLHFYFTRIASQIESKECTGFNLISFWCLLLPHVLVAFASLVIVIPIKFRWNELSLMWSSRNWESTEITHLIEPRLICILALVEVSLPFRFPNSINNYCMVIW